MRLISTSYATTCSIAEGSPRPPNAPLTVPDELANVPGFDASLIERLRPFVAALPPGGKINLNTASAEVLSATLDVSIDRARNIVAQRTIAYFRGNSDLEKFSIPLPDMSRFDVQSEYFLASGRAKFGTATTRMQVLLDRKNNWPDILWQKIL